MLKRAAIILGASEWPKSRLAFPGSINFRRSAKGFREYISRSDTLAISPDFILDLFDNPDAASEIDEAIDVFLRLEHLSGVSELFLFYTGHGAYVEAERRYCFALRSTRATHIGSSGYRLTSLARTLNKAAWNANKFLIIDACYAGAATQDFMPQSSEAIESDAFETLGNEGTALLCASSAAEVALNPPKSKYTMFSGGLLSVLEEGSAGGPPLLSFKQVADLVDRKLRTQFRHDAVHPEVHAPVQRKGSITDLGIFPNPATMTPKEAQGVFDSDRAAQAPQTPPPLKPSFWKSKFYNTRSAYIASAATLIAAIFVTVDLLQPLAQAPLAPFPPKEISQLRVAIHIPSTDDFAVANKIEETAKRIERGLDREGILTVGIAGYDDTSSNNKAKLVYYSDRDAAIAKALAAFISADAEVQVTRSTELNAAPGQLDIWMKR